MEHKGLVARVEEDLERTIALGRSGRGSLPSEREMARRYGVSRTTVRGALQGLAARGLIVKHPGRQSRTVGLDQALTLESLKLALPEEGRPGHALLIRGGAPVGRGLAEPVCLSYQFGTSAADRGALAAGGGHAPGSGAGLRRT